MSDNIYSPQDFIKNSKFNSYSANVQLILNTLLDNLNAEDIVYVVKIGRGKNEIISLSLEGKPSSNIATIYIHREHIRIKVREFNKMENLVSENDVARGSDIVLDILDKYHDLTRGKRQLSIYVYSDVLDKIEDIATAENKKPNEIIEQFLHEKTAGMFLSRRHKAEFVTFLKQANMYKNDLDYLNDKTFQTLNLFYLLAAFQQETKDRFGEKFSFSSTDEDEYIHIHGPIYLLDQCELDVSDGENFLVFALFLHEGLKNRLNIKNLTLQEILTRLHYDHNLLPLTVNALRIIAKEFKINVNHPDIFVKPEPLCVVADVSWIKKKRR